MFWGWKSPSWSRGLCPDRGLVDKAPQMLKQFAGIVYRFLLQKRSKFVNFRRIDLLILDQCVSRRRGLTDILQWLRSPADAWCHLWPQRQNFFLFFVVFKLRFTAVGNVADLQHGKCIYVQSCWSYTMIMTRGINPFNASCSKLSLYGTALNVQRHTGLTHHF